jgi:hypothetical protein
MLGQRSIFHSIIHRRLLPIAISCTDAKQLYNAYGRAASPNDQPTTSEFIQFHHQTICPLSHTFKKQWRPYDPIP